MNTPLPSDAPARAAPLALAPAAPLLRVAGMVGLLLLVALAFWPTTQSIVVRWTDTLSRAYTHGSLIVLLSIYLLWRRREAIARVPARPSLAGLASMLLLGVAWLFFLRSSVQIAHQVLLPLLWLAAIATAFGFAMWRTVWLPVGFLYFTVPAWDVFVPLLQWISVYATRAALSVVGIPVYFDGLEFQIPAGRFQIADGCSGLHFFIVGLAIATFYGELHDDRWRARFKLMALVVLVGMVSNWLRIIILIVVGHATDMQHHLVATEHYSFGWGIFAVAMVGYFLIVRRWPVTPVAPAPESATEPTRVIPGLALATLGIAIPAAWQQLDHNVAALDERSMNLPSPAGWRREPAGVLAPPHFAGVDRELRATYVSSESRIDAYLGIYRRQAQGRELGGFGNQPLGPELRALHAGRGTEPRWLEIEARDPQGGSWLAWVSYAIDDRFHADAGQAQWTYGRASFLGDPLSRVFVLRTRCLADCSAARATLARFTADASLTGS